MEKTYYVYEHVNKTNGKRYIGITSKKYCCQRWQKGKGYKTNKHFWRAIEKYGWDGFEHNILLKGVSEAEAKYAEIYLIAWYNTTNPDYGYNTTAGGEARNMNLPEGHEQEMSRIRNRRYYQNHKEELRQKGKDGKNHERYMARQEASKEYTRKYYQEHKDEIKARRRAKNRKEGN